MLTPNKSYSFVSSDYADRFKKKERIARQSLRSHRVPSSNVFSNPHHPTPSSKPGKTDAFHSFRSSSSKSFHRVKEDLILRHPPRLPTPYTRSHASIKKKIKTHLSSRVSSKHLSRPIRRFRSVVRSSESQRVASKSRRTRAPPHLLGPLLFCMCKQ